MTGSVFFHGPTVAPSSLLHRKEEKGSETSQVGKNLNISLSSPCKIPGHLIFAFSKCYFLLQFGAASWKTVPVKH